MESALIDTVAQYGPWGVSAVLLIMNWFVIKKLFETLDRHNTLFAEKLEKNAISTVEVVKELSEMVSEMRRRPCLKEREDR
jgi:hypothetical protein